MNTGENEVRQHLDEARRHTEAARLDEESARFWEDRGDPKRARQERERGRYETTLARRAQNNAISAGAEQTRARTRFARDGDNDAQSDPNS